MKFIKVFSFLFFMLFTAHSHGETGSRQITEQILVDGMERKIISYIPANDGKVKMPLVISLHGGFATPKAQFRLADFRPIADRDKFIVVCPASKRIWHDGADNNGIDDVKFIDELITHEIEKYNADPTRVYVTGISNGGFMTTRLACEIPERIAAIAVVAATLDVGEGYDIKSPIPVIYMHGTADRIVKYEGGKLFGRRMYSHPDVIEKWVVANGCDPVPEGVDLPDVSLDGTSVFKQEYVNSENGIKVVSYTIGNGGHTWPGGRQYFPEFIIGKTTRNMNACQTIWDFFKTYKKKQA